MLALVSNIGVTEPGLGVFCLITPSIGNLSPHSLPIDGVTCTQHTLKKNLFHFHIKYKNERPTDQKQKKINWSLRDRTPTS